MFISGCFWLGCLEHGTTPRTNTRFWAEKIARNRVRDVDTTGRVEAYSLVVLSFGEHEDPRTVLKAIGLKVRRN